MAFGGAASATAPQSAGAAGTLVDPADVIPPWRRLGYSNEAEWIAAGRPTTPKAPALLPTRTSLAQDPSQVAPLPPRRFEFTTGSARAAEAALEEPFVTAPPGSLRAELQRQRQGATVNPIAPVTEPIGEAISFVERPITSAIRTVREPVIDTVGAAGEAGAFNAIPGFAALPSGLRGDVARTAADIALPNSAVELGLELIPGIGFVPDVARAARRGAQAAGRSEFADVIRRGGANLGPGEAGSIRVPDPDSIRALLGRSGDRDVTAKYLRGYTKNNLGIDFPENFTRQDMLDALKGAVDQLPAEAGARTTRTRPRAETPTTQPEDLSAALEASVQQARPGATVQRIAVKEGGLSPLDPDSLVGSRGAQEITDPAKARVLGPDEAPSPDETVVFHGGTIEGDIRPGTNVTPSEADAATFARMADRFADLEGAAAPAARPLPRNPFAGKTPEQIRAEREALGAGGVPPSGPPPTGTAPPPPSGPFEPPPATGPASRAAQGTEINPQGSFEFGFSDAMTREMGSSLAQTPARTPGQSWGNRVLSVVRNLPNEFREAVAGMDFSFMLRQGIFQVRHTPEFFGSFISGIRGGFDPNYALGRMALLRAKDRRGLFLADLPDEFVGSGLARREESFGGSFISKLPGYRQTARANVLFMNELRAKVYDQIERAWGRTGWLNSSFARGNDLDAMANYINRSTGRGTLGPIEDTWVNDLLAFGLFSPRYLASRPEALLNMFNFRNPRVAIEATKDFAATFGAVASILALANESGLAEVNLDPTSSEFGKFKIGPARVDPWAGFQQLATLTARVISGASDPEELEELAVRFLRTKLAPFPGTVYDLTVGNGRDLLGRKIDERALATSFMPIFMQGIVEGAQEGLLGETMATLPAEFFGLGAQVYVTADERINQRLHETEPNLTTPDGQPITDFQTFRQHYPAAADAWRNQHQDVFEAKLETASDLAREDAALIEEYKLQQEARDAQLLATDPETWRYESGAASRALGIQRHQIWKDEDFERDDSLPLNKVRNAYHDTIDANTDEETGIVDWDAVDAWVTSQPEYEQELLFQSSLEHETEARKQFLRDRRELKEYWDQRDKAWRELVKNDPYMSRWDKVENAVLDMTNQFMSQGLSRAEARVQAESLVEDYLDTAREDAYLYLAEHPELIPMLDKYGYYVPSIFRDLARPTQ